MRITRTPLMEIVGVSSIRNAFAAGRITTHDMNRLLKALSADVTDVEAVGDAVRALQSTDAPELMPVHDQYMQLYNELRETG